MERIWGFDNEAEINVVWVYVSYLRKKLAALHAIYPLNPPVTQDILCRRIYDSQVKN